MLKFYKCDKDQYNSGASYMLQFTGGQPAFCISITFIHHRYVIHTVGPRYNAKYRTAAESALYNCYRNVLQIVRCVVIVMWVCPVSHVSFTGNERCTQLVSV